MPPTDPASALTRRDFLHAGGAVALAATSAAAPALSAASAARRNLIATENAREGSRDWQLTRVRVDRDGFRSPWIEGYCSKQSVRAGESIDIMASANPARQIRLEIFRTGYYGGRGARKMTELGPLKVPTQATPTPGEKNLHECRWRR